MEVYYCNEILWNIYNFILFRKAVFSSLKLAWRIALALETYLVVMQSLPSFSHSSTRNKLRNCFDKNINFHPSRTRRSYFRIPKKWCGQNMGSHVYFSVRLEVRAVIGASTLSPLHQ